MKLYPDSEKKNRKLKKNNQNFFKKAFCIKKNCTFANFYNIK
jgi:hypothetical protein